MRRASSFIMFACSILAMAGLASGQILNDTRGSPTIEEEVYAQIDNSPDGCAYVFIILQPVGPFDPARRPAHQADVARLQNVVLARLGPERFTPVYQYRNFPVMTGYVDAQVLAQLAADEDVLRIGPVGRVEACLAESVPFIRADRAQDDYCQTGDGVVVAVLDTGIDTNHPDLMDDLAPGSYHFLGGGSDYGTGAEDDHGHGTNVAGIITSAGVVAPRGVAPDADILAIKVLDANGSGSIADVIAGIDYAVGWQNGSHRVSVINMSLGKGAYPSCPCDNDDSDTLALQTALQAAKDAGIVTFASSGNQGHPDRMKAPACVSAATAVAAVYDQEFGREPDSNTYGYYYGGFPECYDDPADPDLITCFSNRSPCNELAAPGRRIAGPAMGGGVDSFGWTGTSQAAPHCAGAAALMLQADAKAQLTPDEIVQTMKQTGLPTVDPYATVPNPRRVDALAATETVFYRWMQGKFAPSNAAAFDQFGYAVAVEGNMSLVGAWGDDTNAYNAGAAYLFWHYADFENEMMLTVLGPQLLASDGGPGDQFGSSVAVSGQTLVIGSLWDDDRGEDSGSAYIFHFDGVDWVEHSKLLASDGGPEDWFGSAVAIDGDTLVVGAVRDNVYGPGSGSAYVFEFDGSNWTQKAKLTPTGGAADDSFGGSVDISGDTVIVGAQYHDHFAYGTDSGKAYVFVKPPGGWTNMTQTGYLLPSDGAAYDYFGKVAISADIIIVGAYCDDDLANRSGSAYVFVKPPGGWQSMTETNKLLPSDGAAGDEYGVSVDISGSFVVVGAWSDDDNADNAGSAYVFHFDGDRWVEVEKYLASDGQEDDHFGYAVAVSSGIAVVGSPHDDDNGSFSGSAYAFIPDLVDCNNNGLPDECEIDGGTAEDCNENGVPDVCDIADGTSEDANGNGIPDECEDECPADFDGDGDVDTADLLHLLGAWGTPDGDVDGDGDTDTADLLALLGAWGACP